MIKSLRRNHFYYILLLALVVPAIFALGLINRNPIPEISKIPSDLYQDPE